MASSLWSSVENPRKYFLLPDEDELPEGVLGISELSGRSLSVDPGCLAPFEITEEQARQWAKDQLGQALGDIRGAVNDKLAEWRGKLNKFDQTPLTDDCTITPDAASGLLDLLKQFPGVIGKGLCGDEQRVDEARNTMAGLQQRLKESGINLGDEFRNFPDRLAALRKEMELELEARKSGKDKNSPG